MKRHFSSFKNLHDLNLEATELRLGLPRTSSPDQEQDSQSEISAKQSKSASRSGRSDSSISTSTTNPSSDADHCHELTKAQVVGWPPVRSYRKNVIIETEKKKKEEKKEIVNMELGIISGMYVKVSLDGAPYLRKVDLKLYQSYQQLLDALEDMFNFKLGRYSEREDYHGCDYVPTYEDKDDDWMMVGDVPWDMFISCCKRIRMMKGSDARGMGCL